MYKLLSPGFSLPKATFRRSANDSSELAEPSHHVKCGYNSNLNATDPEGNEAMISKTLESIKDGVAAVNTAVETPALLYFNKKALDDALQERGQLAMKFADSFAPRRVVAGSILSVKGTEISESNMILQDRGDRFRNGSIDGRPILLEMFGYDPTLETGDPYPETVNQVENMAGILCNPNRTSLEVLPCVGYFHGELHSCFCLAFGPQCTSKPQEHTSWRPESRRSYYNCTAEMESRGESSGKGESEEGKRANRKPASTMPSSYFRRILWIS